MYKIAALRGRSLGGPFKKLSLPFFVPASENGLSDKTRTGQRGIHQNHMLQEVLDEACMDSGVSSEILETTAL